jgi:hypothetical protein
VLSAEVEQQRPYTSAMFLFGWLSDVREVAIVLHRAHRAGRADDEVRDLMQAH